MADFIKEQEELREKASTVSSIKSIAVTQGGTPLTTQNIASVLKTIETTVVNRINQMAVNTTKQFLPIDSQLKQVNDLLSSNSEKDIDKGFELIDRLQSRLGIDLSKYSKEIGDAVQKLYDMNRQRKEDKADAKRIQVEKTEELIKERDILRERGINTVLNEKGTKLMLLTKQQEREELKRIRIEEREIDKAKEKAVSDAKNLQNNDKILARDRNKILKDNEKITKREEDLQKAKERMGLKPKDRVSGMLDQTVGEAFRQIKTFGKEISQLGGDIFGGVKKSFNFVTDSVSGFGKGFKKVGGDLMSGFGKLAGATKGLIIGFVGMFIAMIKFILIALVVGVVIYAVFKAIMFVIDIIKGVIDFFKESFEKLMDIWPFSLIGDDEADEKGEEAKDKAESYRDDDAGTAGDTRAETYMPQQDEEKKESKMRFLTDKELPREMREDSPINRFKKDQKEIKRQIDERDELNKLSVENQASSKSAGNTVIAPSVSNNNSNVNASNTQAMSMEPTNFDRSFINLNTVPI